MADLFVDKLKTSLRSGVRTNLFQCIINPPAAIGALVTGGEASGGLGSNLDTLSVLCKAAQIPQGQLGTIEVPFRGAKLKVPGDRAFEPWTVTILNDPDMAVRAYFERWQNVIRSNAQNEALNTSLLDIFANMEVKQLNQKGEQIGTSWNIVGAWPSDVSSIDLSYDDENTLSQFTVTFQYQYWVHQGATDMIAGALPGLDNQAGGDGAGSG
tara:strand:+ start:1053 stop:1688 length:636 start_codon:yes stop_codon:yes gene_type:complete